VSAGTPLNVVTVRRRLADAQAQVQYWERELDESLANTDEELICHVGPGYSVDLRPVKLVTVEGEAIAVYKVRKREQ
jgi:hypothetical protein